MSGGKTQSPLEVTAKEARRATEQGVSLVDIRSAAEQASGMAEGSVAMTWAEVQARCSDDPDWCVNLVCAGGARSLVLAATLRRQGRTHAASVSGGLDRWKAEGFPIERPEPEEDPEPEQSERYARHVVMPQVGPEGQEKLSRARVLLTGLGGLNSPAALYLAAAGVGTLGLVDHDRVERSNLQRQVLHGEAFVGQKKTRSAQRRLADINPDVETVIIDQCVDAGNAARLVQDWDVVIDGTDNFPVRHALNAACVATGIPLVYGAVMRFQGQVSVFWPSADPGGKTPCLDCLLPESETATAPPSCAEAGVLGVLPGIVGTLQATEALKLILGIGEPLTGQLLMIDALTMEFRKTRIKPSPSCPVCSHL